MSLSEQGTALILMQGIRLDFGTALGHQGLVAEHLERLGFWVKPEQVAIRRANPEISSLVFNRLVTKKTKEMLAGNGFFLRSCQSGENLNRWVSWVSK